MKEVTKHERKMSADSPWGAGYPLGGQLNGCPSIPKSVYSCSMPNQMLCSLICSITLLQLCRWLVSSRDRKSDQLVCPELPGCYYEKKDIAVDGNVNNVPAGKRLYFRTSQRTSLFGSSVNGSLKMRTGLRYMSLLEPSAWYVLEPSKFHSGMSDDKNVPKGHHQNTLLYLSCVEGTVNKTVRLNKINLLKPFRVSIPVKCFIYRISVTQQSLHIFSFARLVDMQIIMPSNQKEAKRGLHYCIKSTMKDQIQLFNSSIITY